MVEGTHRRLGYYVQKAATELARSDIDEAIRKSFEMLMTCHVVKWKLVANCI